MLLVTATSPTYTPEELVQAREMADQFGGRFRVIGTDEFEDPSFLENPPDRCFYCKSDLFGKLEAIRAEEGLSCLFDGSNADDTADFRPGGRAARKYAVRSPLREAGFTKADVRELSRALGLPTWNQPARACLASRFPYGTRLSAEEMQRVAEAEAVLYALGFTLVRVRHHGDTARIEVPEEEIARFSDAGLRGNAFQRIRDLGYTYVTLDLRGYRTGSMNETLTEEEKRRAAGKG